MYFDLITIGIATSVRTKWAVQLLLCSVIIIILVKVVQKIYNKFGRSFYSMSFNEGNITNTIEIISSKRIELIEKNNNLANYLSDQENSQFTYRLNFNDKGSLEEFKEKLNNEKNINKINVVFN
jgi:hypothetical protein